MAKISKKPPVNMAPLDADEINRLILEGTEEIYLNTTEPITHIPNVDVYSTTGEVIIEVEMPGVRKEDIEVSVYKNTLTVKALKYECFDDNKINYVCLERAFGRLYRAVELPLPVDTGRIKAVYKNGVLMVTIPRITEEKRSGRKQIPIESK